MKKLYVITAEEWDHSGFSVLRVLLSGKRAELDKALLDRAMVGKKIEVHEVEYDDTFPKGLSGE